MPKPLGSPEAQNGSERQVNGKCPTHLIAVLLLVAFHVKTSGYLPSVFFDFVQRKNKKKENTSCQLRGHHAVHLFLRWMYARTCCYAHAMWGATRERRCRLGEHRTNERPISHMTFMQAWWQIGSKLCPNQVYINFTNEPFHHGMYLFVLSLLRVETTLKDLRRK